MLQELWSGGNSSGGGGGGGSQVSLAVYSICSYIKVSSTDCSSLRGVLHLYTASTAFYMVSCTSPLACQPGSSAQNDSGSSKASKNSTKPNGSAQNESAAINLKTAPAEKDQTRCAAVALLLRPDFNSNWTLVSVGVQTISSALHRLRYTKRSHQMSSCNPARRVKVHGRSS